MCLCVPAPNLYQCLQEAGRCYQSCTARVLPPTTRQKIINVTQLCSITQLVQVEPEDCLRIQTHSEMAYNKATVDFYSINEVLLLSSRGLHYLDRRSDLESREGE